MKLSISAGGKSTHFSTISFAVIFSFIPARQGQRARAGLGGFTFRDSAIRRH